MALSNNVTRVIVAVLFIPLIVAAAYFGGIFFFLFTAFIVLGSFYELIKMARKKEMHGNLWAGFLSVSLILVNQYVPFLDFFSLLVLIILILIISELFRNNGSAIYNLGAVFLGILYLGILGSSLLGIREFYPQVGTLYNRGGYIIISIFASIWICDSAAYYGGTALGKHKLFPRVSPAKTWEGAIFGLIFAILAMAAAKFLLLDFLSWQTIIVLGIIVGIIGQLGDLTESLLKRDAGIKDSSALIPGHGGIFDRFDSLFLSAPVILLYLKYIDR